MAESVKEIVTRRIIEAMEKGSVPWRKPWSSVSTRPCNISGHKYKGLNFFITSMMPFAIPVYLTFNQAKKMGGNVKSGEKGIQVMCWKILKKTEDEVEKNVPMLRYFTVFNISQCDGVPLPKRFQPAPRGPEFDPIADCEKIIADMPNAPKITFGGDRACYIPSLDEVHLPAKADFSAKEEFYSTAFHELAHSTGHKTRLNRKEVVNTGHFGSMDYSLEELVAELTSAILCAETSIDQPVLDNQAAYIKSWLTKLKDDPGMLITAAGRAAKAAAYIINREDEPEPDEA